HVLHLAQLTTTPNPFLSQPGFLEGVSNDVISPDTPDIDRWLLEKVASWRPQVVVLCGWLYRPYVRLAHARELRHTRIVLGMDSPWRGTMTQRLAAFRLGTLIQKADVVVTAGERSAEYARRIGVSESRIRAGYYGFDYERFSAIGRERSA